MAEKSQDKSIRSLEKAFQIVELLMSEGDQSLSDIARELDAPKSTVHYYMKTLCKHRYIVKRDGKYAPGLRFLTVGGHALSQHRLFRRLDEETVRRHVDELAERTGETAVIAVEEAGRGIFLYQAQVEGGADVTVNIGMECHLHSTAVGKAFLAGLSNETVETFIDRHGLPKSTDQTIDSRADIREEISRVRDDRIAYEDEEWVPGQRGIAAPIVDRNDGMVVAAIGVIGSVDSIERVKHRGKAERFSSDKVKIVQQTAKIAESKLLLQDE